MEDESDIDKRIASTELEVNALLCANDALLRAIKVAKDLLLLIGEIGPRNPTECDSLEELQPWLDIRGELKATDELCLEAMLATGGMSCLNSLRSRVKGFLTDIEESSARLA